jgi:hypothetical protein
VERPHRELRAGLADRLGRDDADGLADVDHAAGRQVAAVAAAADAAARLAGEDRADLHLLDARLLDARGDLLGDDVVRLDDDGVRRRVVDVLLDVAADDAVAERLEDLAALDDRRDGDAVERAAVLLVDDDVLGDVDEAAGEVAGVPRGSSR